MDRLMEHVGRTTWQGAISSASHSGFSRQWLCGDELWVDVVVEGGVIRLLRYRGQGCAVSTACASILCEAVEGLRVEYVLLQSAEALMDFPMSHLSKYKQHCATLGWEALRAALLSDLSTISNTEPVVASTPSSSGVLSTTKGIPP